MESGFCRVQNVETVRCPLPRKWVDLAAAKLCFDWQVAASKFSPFNASLNAFCHWWLGSKSRVDCKLQAIDTSEATEEVYRFLLKCHSRFTYVGNSNCGKKI
jgi:hypothetical protein